METYTEQEAAAKLQRIAQILTDGTIAARKLSQPLDAALHPKVLTEALQPFEAATITGTPDGLSIYGAAKLQPLFGTPDEYKILQDWGRTWRGAMIDFIKAWRDLLETKRSTAETAKILEQLEYGIEDCIEGRKEWADENGWPTGESTPHKYFTLLQKFKLQLADLPPDQPRVQSANPYKEIKDETPTQIESRRKAFLLIINTYLVSNPKGGKSIGLRKVLKTLLNSKDSDLAMALQECAYGFTWNEDIDARVDNAKKKFEGWLDSVDSGCLSWPNRYKEITARYRRKAKQRRRSPGSSKAKPKA